MNKYDIAVVGATGAVGREIMNVLKERNFPINNIYALASRASIGREISFGEKDIVKIESLDSFDFSKVDIAIFSAGSNIAKRYVSKAAESGCYVIDNSSAFRKQENVPLIVPEINAEKIGDAKIISNPNCVAIPVAIALKQITQIANIKRVVISTYQSVSGAGRKAMDDLYQQTKGSFIYQEASHKNRPIAFNLIPQIGEFNSEGVSDEEEKIINETNKILETDFIISATAVRVPVFIGHSIALNVELDSNVTKEQIISIFSDQDHTFYQRDIITPKEIVKIDEVVVSRVRVNKNYPSIVDLWLCSDNLRKGAALNAVQIAEHIVSEE